MNTYKSDILIVGSGAAGLFAALHLPVDKKVTIITKRESDKSDSFLAQGGMCVLKENSDYDSFYNDTMRAGHYENRKESVDLMIRSSHDIATELLFLGVEFEKDENGLKYTREGGHSTHRILFHKDETGKEITSTLLKRTLEKDNITIFENTTMIDLICDNNQCYGVVATSDTNTTLFTADFTILACGGIGGLYKNSTNYSHISGDGISLAKKHNIKLENPDYIQIHPTTFYSEKPGRRFLISESVRGEGAILLNKNGKRFVDELLPRDLLTAKIKEQMKKDNSNYVMLSMEPIDSEIVISHFPNIYKKCLEEGYDCTKVPIPVVPAQHYYMGGIWVDKDSHTSMNNLYAVGETSCNGVHGKNRLASNSLLESLVFSKRCAEHINEAYKASETSKDNEAIIQSYLSSEDKYNEQFLLEAAKDTALNIMKIKQEDLK